VTGRGERSTEEKRRDKEKKKKKGREGTRVVCPLQLDPFVLLSFLHRHPGMSIPRAM